MIAEKAADRIMNNTPLPPAKVNFHRHQPRLRDQEQALVLNESPLA
jgi:hypothetical protein